MNQYDMDWERDHAIGDYGEFLEISETTEAICLNCGNVYRLHEAWNQHGGSLRCPVMAADILIGFQDHNRWGFGGLVKRVTR